MEIDYSKKTMVELKEILKSSGIKGYSSLKKNELVDLVMSLDEKKKKSSSVSSYDSWEDVQDLTKLGVFTTSTLAFIYQACHPENRPYLPDHFTFSGVKFTYDDAIECANDIESEKWEQVRAFLDHTVKDFMNFLRGYVATHSTVLEKIFLIGININLFMDLFKKEALEYQKGNITILHAKDIRYLVLDIVAQIVSGSYEGFKPRCSRKEKDTKTASEWMTEKMKPYALAPSLDHITEFRKILISGNTSILNNLFVMGESTFEFFYRGSVMEPNLLLSHLNLPKETLKFVKNIMKQLQSHLLAIYSFPISILEKYVYPSYAYGKLHKEPNIYHYLESYLDKNPWRSNFEWRYKVQMRILDLCYTKFAHKDGVRIYQFTDLPMKKLETMIDQIENKLLLDKTSKKWFTDYVDVAQNPVKRPTERIFPFEERKLLKTKKRRDKKEIDQEIDQEIDLIVEGITGLKVSDGKEEIKEGKQEMILHRAPVSVLSTKTVIPKPKDDLLIVPMEDIDYKKKTVVELKKIAKERGLKGYSKLRKDELIELFK